MSKKGKKKKERVTYVDDGRTIADMSNVGGSRLSGSKRGSRPPSSLRDQWNTYWAAVKMMIVPMLVVIGIITAAFLIMYLSVKGI